MNRLYYGDNLDVLRRYIGSRTAAQSRGREIPNAQPSRKQGLLPLVIKCPPE